MTKRIYIAGPMSDCDNYNFESFEWAAKHLRDIGYEPVSPAEVHGIKDDWEWEDYLKADLALLIDCDAIVMLAGWEESRGACLEHDTARRLGLSVMEFDARGRLQTLEEEGDDEPTILTEAQRLVFGPREADYGHPILDLGRAARIWSVILDAPVSAQQVALCMIGTKISRELHRPKEDNRIDIAGYAAVLDRIETYEGG